MAQGSLLLMVQVTCAPEHLEPFNLWYNSHLPNLLRIPGYLWANGVGPALAQRYMGMEDPSRFVALYGVRSEDDLPNLLDWDGPDLHPIAKAEFADWQKLQGTMSDVMVAW